MGQLIQAQCGLVWVVDPDDLLHGATYVYRDACKGQQLQFICCYICLWWAVDTQAQTVPSGRAVAGRILQLLDTFVIAAFMASCCAPSPLY